MTQLLPPKPPNESKTGRRDHLASIIEHQPPSVHVSCDRQPMSVARRRRVNQPTTSILVAMLVIFRKPNHRPRLEINGRRGRTLHRRPAQSRRLHRVSSYLTYLVSRLIDRGRTGLLPFRHHCRLVSLESFEMIAIKRINFNQLAKPANLQNSAVLRMLEEEETRQRGGQPGLKRVAWPPPPEDQDFDYVEQTPIQAKTRGYGDLGSYQSSPTSGPSPQPSSAVASQNAVPSSPSVSPGGTLLRQPSHFQQQTNPKGWAPVTPPATSPLPHQQHPLSQHQQATQQPWQQHPQDPYDRTPQRQNQQNQPSYHPSPAAFEAPPSTIVLRPSPPISQTPAPVYQAQPAATKAPATGNMRGDLKWPPASVKAQVEAENRARIDLARGPAFRPRRVNKDYSGFFAQHTLTNNYPGYRAPPGTQYFTPAYHH